MEWTKRDEIWVSGPYVIELVEPRHWLMTITPVAGEERSFVRVDNTWTASSLSELKARAEELQQAKEHGRAWRRSLLMLAASVLVLVGAMGSSGRLAATVAIVAFITSLALVSRVMDGLERRPWDSLRGNYQ